MELSILLFLFYFIEKFNSYFVVEFYSENKHNKNKLNIHRLMNIFLFFVKFYVLEDNSYFCNTDAYLIVHSPLLCPYIVRNVCIAHIYPYIFHHIFSRIFSGMSDDLR